MAGSVANDTKAIGTAYNKLQADVQTYGRASTQAKADQLAFNQAMALTTPVVAQAESAS